MKVASIPKFMDSLSPAELFAVIDHWRRLELPPSLTNLFPAHGPNTFNEISGLFQSKIRATHNPLNKKRLENSIIGWLYDFIRLNVKRGRVYNLGEVLKTGRADCLGYAKIFTTLGRYCGLDTGVVEVIIDNRGMNVPHTAILVTLPGNNLRFVDFWYGSKDIKHQRLGLRIGRSSERRIEDSDYRDLHGESVTYLPDRCIDAITLYIEGNRSLKNTDYRKAIQQYSDSTRLYPLNSRTFYNRAIAYENLGDLTRAKTDYARAFQDNSSLLRTLATQPEEIVDLMYLDEKNVPELRQEVYLLRHGFITGKKVLPFRIARIMGLSVEEVADILHHVKPIP